jgi:hypothetical protein
MYANICSESAPIYDEGRLLPALVPQGREGDPPSA